MQRPPGPPMMGEQQQDPSPRSVHSAHATGSRSAVLGLARTPTQPHQQLTPLDTARCPARLHAPDSVPRRRRSGLPRCSAPWSPARGLPWGPPWLCPHGQWRPTPRSSWYATAPHARHAGCGSGHAADVPGRGEWRLQAYIHAAVTHAFTRGGMTTAQLAAAHSVQDPLYHVHCQLVLNNLVPGGTVSLAAGAAAAGDVIHQGQLQQQQQQEGPARTAAATGAAASWRDDNGMWGVVRGQQPVMGGPGLARVVGCCYMCWLLLTTMADTGLGELSS
jgi:hypothetical protein